jgi:multisubunit Na+/H+ antiporter MnhB subunit
MKKAMIISGVFSSCAIAGGIIFKYMHWPGAAAIIPGGILIADLLFIPLLFILRNQNEDNRAEKQLSVLMAFSLSFLCLCFAFKIILGPGYTFSSMTLFALSAVVMFTGHVPLRFKTERKRKREITFAGTRMVILIAHVLLFSLIAGSRLRNRNAESNPRLAGNVEMTTPR